MNLKEITSDLADGKATLEGMNFRVIQMESKSRYFMSRLHLITETGEIFIIEGKSSGFEVLQQVHPAPNKIFVLSVNDKTLELKSTKIFDSRPEAETWAKNSLSDSYEWSIEEQISPPTCAPQVVRPPIYNPKGRLDDQIPF